MDPAGDDDDAELDLPIGGPTHPDDRLWRHPSELASAGLPSAWRPDTSRRSIRDRWIPVVLAGTVGALLTASLLAAAGAFDGALVAASSPASATSSTVALTVRSAAPNGVADVAERLRPSLLALVGVGADGRPSRGSAVAIRAGHVLTAARLVVGAEQLEVLVQGVNRHATLVGADPDTDLAVLAVDGGGLVPAPWGDAVGLHAGDPAVAVSSPPSAEPGPTVTAGVVSGIDRTLTYAGAELRGLLQLDRPVPAEGAGGALVDPAGALVGITLPAPVASAPFGYAVPAEEAREVAGQLLTRGRVAHAWLGVEGGDKGLDGGAMVQRVRPASPAATGGVLEGDVVTSLDDRSTPTMGVLLLRLRVHQPGETVRLGVLRGGRRLELPVTLSERD